MFVFDRLSYLFLILSHLKINVLSHIHAVFTLLIEFFPHDGMFSDCKQPTEYRIVTYSYEDRIEGVIEACVIVNKPTRETDLFVKVSYRGCGKYPYTISQ